MKTFVIADVHGEYRKLYKLLLKAGVLGEGHSDHHLDDFYRTTEIDGEPYQCIQLGDLVNAVESSEVGDGKCILAANMGWFDKVLLGNHDAGYVYGSQFSFGGYYEHPHLSSAYRSLVHTGVVVPSFVIGNTLITHAGVAAKWDFASAPKAHEAVTKMFQDQHAKDRGLLLDVGFYRGGFDTYGGILWSDWREKKNQNFNQVVGHSVHLDSTRQIDHDNGNWILDIDCGIREDPATATGVWLDEEGQIIEVVKGD